MWSSLVVLVDLWHLPEKPATLTRSPIHSDEANGHGMPRLWAVVSVGGTVKVAWLDTILFQCQEWRKKERRKTRHVFLWCQSFLLFCTDRQCFVVLVKRSLEFAVTWRKGHLQKQNKKRESKEVEDRVFVSQGFKRFSYLMTNWSSYKWAFWHSRHTSGPFGIQPRPLKRGITCEGQHILRPWFMRGQCRWRCTEAAEQSDRIFMGGIAVEPVSQWLTFKAIVTILGSQVYHLN